MNLEGLLGKTFHPSPCRGNTTIRQSSPLHCPRLPETSHRARLSASLFITIIIIAAISS